MSQENKKITLTLIINASTNFKSTKKIFESLKKQKLSQAGRIQTIVFGENNSLEIEKKINNNYGMFKTVFCKTEQDVLENINGKYVNFSNGEDTWDEGALDLICTQLEKNKDVECAVGNALLLRKKGGKRNSTKNKLIDIEEKPQAVVDDLKTMVINSKLVKKAPKLSTIQSEESTMVTLETVLLAKKYILIPDAIVWHGEKTGFAYNNKEKFLSSCMKATETICGETTEYAYHFMFDLVYKSIVYVGDKAETIKCMQLIPDEIIGSSNLYSKNGRLWEEKRYAYQLKHGEDSLKEVGLQKDGRVYFGDVYTFDVKENSLFQVVILSVDDKTNTLTLEGYDRTNYIDPKAQAFVRDEKGEKYPLEVTPFIYDDFIGCDNEVVQKGKRFKVSIPLHFGMKLEFVIKHSKTGEEYACKFSREIFIKVHPHYVHSYYVKKPYLVQLEGNAIRIEKTNPIKHTLKEILYLIELASKGQGAQACYRLAYWGSNIFKTKKPIWIVNDRPHKAGDNGEALFKYLMQTPLAQTHKIYFMLSDKSPDYERLSKIGPVLKYYSRQHKIKFLQADKIISSIGNDLPINPFGKSRKFYNDLYKADFIYLRHGIAKDDQSHWLNRFKRNYRLINSSAKREFEAISSGNYLYSENQAVLCGLPRFDNLKSDNKNRIVILPTWRKNLQGIKDQYSELRAYNSNFAESDFCKFYNGLINDEKLLKVMREHGFTGNFYLHPVMSAQAKDFKGNDVISVHKEIADYQKEFAESNIMITDFSSVAFDFAYLKKPVIYSQFDKDSFYNNHSWERGYFTYEDDGFGMITQDVETTRDAIINYIENGCQMEQKYIDRVDKFFAYTDRNNCKRMAEAILKTENE